MVSGYVCGMRDYLPGIKGYWRSFIKNFVGLYLPCIMLSLADFGIMYFLVPSYRPAFSSLEFRPADIFMFALTGFHKFWFLNALFFIKIIHAALEQKKLNSIFWPLIFTAAYFEPLLLNLSYGFFFHAGYIMKRKNYMNSPDMRYGAIIFFVGMLSFFVPYSFESINILTKLSAAFCTSIGLFMIFYALRVSNSFLVLCGVNSMVIYSLHAYPNGIFKMLFRLLGWQRFMNVTLSFSICLAMGILVPLFVVWLYKNVKPLRWIEYIFYPGKLLLKK